MIAVDDLSHLDVIEIGDRVSSHPQLAGCTPAVVEQIEQPDDERPGVVLVCRYDNGNTTRLVSHGSNGVQCVRRVAAWGAFINAQRVGEARSKLRIVSCVRCTQPADVAGASYCDECRPLRLSDELLTDVDRERLTS